MLGDPPPRMVRVLARRGAVPLDQFDKFPDAQAIKRHPLAFHARFDADELPEPAHHLLVFVLDRIRVLLDDPVWDTISHNAIFPIEGLDSLPTGNQRLPACAASTPLLV